MVVTPLELLQNRMVGHQLRQFGPTVYANLMLYVKYFPFQKQKGGGGSGKVEAMVWVLNDTAV